MATALYSHPDCVLHDMGEWHPECPRRLQAIEDQPNRAQVPGIERGRDLDKVVDLAQLFAGEAPWQPVAEGPTVFKSVGVGLADVAAASAALALLAPQLVREAS